MKRGLTISLIGHGAFLIWALVSFARPLPVSSAESMPVDVISADEFTAITAGAKDAPKTQAPKPLVEKIAEAKPVEDTTSKIVEKREVVAAAEATPAPEPTPKPPEPKPAAAPQQEKTEAKAPEKKEPEQKVDPIAEALKKEDAKKPEKKAETKPQSVKKPEVQQPKFDPRKVAALLDKRDPQRLAAAGDTINLSAGVGAPRGTSAQLSQNEMDALRARIQQCWTMPPGSDASKVVVEVRMQLRKDGSLQASPAVLSGLSSPVHHAVAETALRAIRQCAPYSFLPPAKYEAWKDVLIGFDASWASRI